MMALVLRLMFLTTIGRPIAPAAVGKVTVKAPPVVSTRTSCPTPADAAPVATAVTLVM